MLVKEFKSILDRTGLPVTYYQWEPGEVPPLPYIVYWIPDDGDYYADGQNYIGISDIRIELYSKEKDWDLETKVENVLKQEGIPYGREETYLKTEEMWMVVYTISIIKTDR